MRDCFQRRGGSGLKIIPQKERGFVDSKNEEFLGDPSRGAGF